MMGCRDKAAPFLHGGLGCSCCHFLVREVDEGAAEPVTQPLFACTHTSCPQRCLVAISMLPTARSNLVPIMFQRAPCTAEDGGLSATHAEGSDG